MKENVAKYASAVFEAEDADVIQAGIFTLDQALEGLLAVKASLGKTFVSAVKLIVNMRGRLIVSGMGKSGHIARKIAATIASTGTPAYFVHPAEASHGDMGMISHDDVLLMLSNSGETAELSEMIHYAKRFSIPIIALVRREKSMLVDVADIPVILPAVSEASPVGAPTTSTMMMLAYCDALAMAVAQQKGFGADDFQLLHPGGKLGKGLLRVSHLMHKGNALPVVSPHDTMADTLLVMTRKVFGCVIVMEEGCMHGIITDGDLRRHISDGLLDKKASEVMTAHPITIKPDMLAAEALNIMNSRSVTCLPVLHDGTLAGLLHIHDCLREGVA